VTQKRSIDLQRHVFPVFLAIASIGLAGASCDKKSSAAGNKAEDNGAIAALDRATLDKEQAEPKKAIEGVDLNPLDGTGKKAFDRMVDSLRSPCGKAESLRKSITVSKDCKRSIFAARYIALMLEEGASEDQARELYAKRYINNDPRTIAVTDKTPHVGSPEAPVKIVEFFDYGCPSCAAAAPALTRLQQDRGSDIVFYYKQFPLEQHVDSRGAAQAALAAGKQGKYREMHDLLFQNQRAQKKDDLVGYAKKIGLDVDKFLADYEASAAAVELDKNEGDAAGVESTPTMYINGRMYSGLFEPRWFDSWIDEELAVNR
jgi:protein-disulfide isomerase